MRRNLSITFSALLAVAGLAAAGVANAGASTAAPTAHVTVKIVSGSACKPAASFCFKPALKTIASGTKVTWKNTTIAPHTVTRCTTVACGVSPGTGTQAGFGSPSTFGSGAKYSFTFKKSGTYVYYCQVHGYALMHGTITVS